MTAPNRRRDLRDPEKLGRLFLSLVRVNKVPVLQAADELDAYFVPSYQTDETCIDRYGRPSDVQPRYEEIQTR